MEDTEGTAAADDGAPTSSVPLVPTPPAPGPSEPGPRARIGPMLLAAGIVVALLGGGIGIAVSGRSGSPTRAGAPSRPASPPGASRVISVTATAASPIEIDLKWTTRGAVRQFSVFRNGTLLTTSTVPEYVDANARPSKTYVYAVTATDPSGHVSPQVSATATTPAPPPLSEARLQGEFLVKATFVSENYTNFSRGQTEALTWRFRPVCDQGACKVRIDVFAPGEQFKALRRKGAEYSGRGTARLGTCGSSTLTTTLTIDVRVSKAKYVADVWQATALTGTLKEYSPPTFSCQSGSSTQRVKATFQGL